MYIAATATKNTMEAFIPERFENSPYLLIIETDDGTIKEIFEAKDSKGLHFANMIKQFDCEAVACGIMQKEAFEIVALAGITRCLGTGCSVKEAVYAAMNNMLPYITDFEGGTGCGSHEEANCSHHHE